MKRSSFWKGAVVGAGITGLVAAAGAYFSEPVYRQAVQEHQRARAVVVDCNKPSEAYVVSRSGWQALPDTTAALRCAEGVNYVRFRAPAQESSRGEQLYRWVADRR
jgi:hypothetical protein